MKKLIIILLILIVLTGSVAFLYYRRNFLAGDVLRFEIDTPESVEAGERIQYRVRYRNNGDTRLEDVELTFEYPENAIPLDSDDEEIKKRGESRRVVDINELNPGEEGIVIFEARLLGRERDSLESFASIRYRPKNLSAEFEEERTHVTYIKEVPLSLSFDFPSSLESGKESTFRLDYSSEMDYAITDLEIRFQYPPGFKFVRSTPETRAEKNDRWPIPVLNKGDGGFVEVDGTLEGDVGDAKRFEAVLGVWKDDRFIPMKDVSKGTIIAETTLFIDVLVNDEIDYVASPGEMLHYKIIFKNLGEETVRDLFLMVDLEKNSFDLNEIEALEGRKSTSSIIWSYTFKPELRSLAKDEEETVEFWAKVKEDGLSFNPNARINVTLESKEKRFSNRVNTKFSFDQEVLFGNTPFELEEPSLTKPLSYAVKWDIKNHFSDAQDIIVKTTLPENVSFAEEKEVENGSFSFDPYKREVIFILEDLSAGSSEEIFFKLELELPEEIEEDEKFKLISEALMEGEDKRTEETIRARGQEIFLKDVFDKIE